MVLVTSSGYPRKRAQTRRRLLRAGMDVVARCGPAGATVGEVAAVAGVATGTFYNHFPSLSDLLDALSEQLASAVEIGMVQLDAVEHDPAARVALATLQLLAVAEDDPVFAAAFLALVNNLPPFRARVRHLVHRAVQDGAGAGRFDVDPGTAVTDALLGAVLQSMRSRLLADADPSSATDVVALVLRLLGLPPDDIAATVERSSSAFRPVAADQLAS